MRLLPPNPLQGHPYGSVQGDLADGAAVTEDTAASVLVATAGLARFRVRLKSSAAGTLSFEYCRADSANTGYGTSNPIDVTITADTEAVLEVDEHFGEGVGRVTFTPDADGTITYCDFSGV